MRAMTSPGATVSARSRKAAWGAGVARGDGVKVQGALDLRGPVCARIGNFIR